MMSRQVPQSLPAAWVLIHSCPGHNISEKNKKVGELRCSPSPACAICRCHPGVHSRYKLTCRPGCGLQQGRCIYCTRVLHLIDAPAWLPQQDTAQTYCDDPEKGGEHFAVAMLEGGSQAEAAVQAVM